MNNTCVYCGKPLPDHPLKLRVKQRDFEVCGEECIRLGEAYLARDRKFKLPLYLIIFAAAIVIIITAIQGGTNMIAANVMQIAVGIAFILLPYPVANFTTFQSCPVRTIVNVTRMIGFVFAVLGIVVLVGALTVAG